MGNSSNRDVTEIERLEKEQQIIQMRRQGLTFDIIAQQLGYANRSGPWKVFQEAKKKLQAEIVESLDDMRWIEHQRNEAILRGGLWQRAQKGEHVAVMDYLSIQKSTREMFGIDAPKRTEVMGANGSPLLPGEPTAADAARLVRELFGDHAAKKSDPIELPPHPMSRDDSGPDLGDESSASEVPASPPRH